VGEHNEEVLGELLGYSEAEIAKLYDEKIIGNWDHYDEVPG
jgi:crotonobetainyl-CoA:carnitine CoA-transferase CaiB-like acyl-CoA transferase